MKKQAKLYLIMLLVVGLLGLAQAASAQLVVSVTSPGNGSYSPGAGISNLGTFIVTNNSSVENLITGVTIGVSNPSAFSTLTLTGTVNGTTQAVNLSPISSSSHANFSFTAILPGGTGSFILSGTATSTLPSPSPGATSTAGSSVILDTGGASLGIWPRGLGQLPNWMMALLLLGLLIAGGKLQRRHLVVLAAGAVMAATQLGCGNVSLFGNGSGSGITSTQSVNALAISSGSVANLPVALGTITVGSGSSSSSGNMIL
ncbi:MAG TPA: hypothetical protein VKV28_03950 [Candidatus Binataceae bacterium]|nr:hypothetical protein [Candidatus Binataceae bacterium]